MKVCKTVFTGKLNVQLPMIQYYKGAIRGISHPFMFLVEISPVDELAYVE